MFHVEHSSKKNAFEAALMNQRHWNKEYKNQ